MTTQTVAYSYTLQGLHCCIEVPAVGATYAMIPVSGQKIVESP